MGHKPGKRNLPPVDPARGEVREILTDAIGLTDDRGRAKPNSERAGGWRTVEKKHLAANPECALCETTDDVAVHHVLPFELFPEHELDPANLITLCQRHHLDWGHLGAWDLFNPIVREFCAMGRLFRRLARSMMQAAKRDRKRR